MKRLWILAILSLPTFFTFADSPTTTRNDDSCDVIIAPAATLLLPYFEVDLSSPVGETTLFTVMNVGALPQIAHVVIWSDWAFPVLDFNLFLTGYDVQSINLYDVIQRGRIAEPGTSSTSSTGERSKQNSDNPLLDVANCDRLPVRIPDILLSDVQRTLTTGETSRCPSSARVGGTHAHAIGYVTIDLVADCGTTVHTDATYASQHLLYDNVLSGDYQQVNSTQNFAQASPMVHIRAFPEGGGPGAKTTNLPRTFYSNFQNGATADRRQPLPSIFATRWIGGGSTSFSTSYKIWREARTTTPCAVKANFNMEPVEFVRFDESENPLTFTYGCPILCPPPTEPLLPPASLISEHDPHFPPKWSDDGVAGWMYMNLNDTGVRQQPREIASQSWVIATMRAEGRYSVDMDAASLGNGCTPETSATNEDGDARFAAVGPAPNANATFATGSPATTNNDDSCDIMVAPAATLLLPYFEVDLANPTGETTLFTVTNVTKLPQIAHLTLWTDWSYPVLSFDVFLTGYDIQSINLYDVIQLGILPATTNTAANGRRSAANTENAMINITACTAPVVNLPESVREQVRRAFTVGVYSTCGTTHVGAAHANARGFVTVDVVQHCGAGLPTDSDYFTSTALYDNVFVGDFQQVNSSQNFAQGNPMVHIRAVPEGLGTGSTNMARTFYSRLQNGATADRRQPLPSTFAARWISGGGTTFNTNFKIWREAYTPASAGCAVAQNGGLDVVEFVRFDESENPTTFSTGIIDPPGVNVPRLSSSFRLNAFDTSVLPPQYSDDDVAGWMYMNLDSAEVDREIANQGWVVVSMAAEGRYSADFDALTLGNGCSAAVAVTDLDGGAPAIGPGVP
ncbi:MAG TPA: hypothetical protein VJZ00_24235 [Thermoanaerobaculia bacterium]|nr:hypothetical protein [Thermoanaerobaculia bacterium]